MERGLFEGERRSRLPGEGELPRRRETPTTPWRGAATRPDRAQGTEPPETSARGVGSKPGNPDPVSERPVSGETTPEGEEGPPRGTELGNRETGEHVMYNPHMGGGGNSHITVTAPSPRPTNGKGAES